MYEVELKVEVAEVEKNKLVEALQSKKFEAGPITTQNDFYVHAQKSPYGGYDITRYRDEDGTFIYTEKVWEVIGGERVQKETERQVSQERFRSTLAEFPASIVIQKVRDWFSGRYQDREITVTIDTVKFDHSPGPRYFLEAEIQVENKEDVPAIKHLVEEFLKEILDRPDIVIAPGMFTMAFEKL